MININEVDWTQPGIKLNRLNNNISGKALAFVVGTEVAYGLSTDEDFADLLLSANLFIENFDYPKKDNFYIVDLIKDGKILNQLMCDELLYSVLLSSPKIIHICEDYENYRLVVAGWHFANNKFYIPEILNYE
jgi:hypothetical protein